ncbi:MAG TPA: class I SAM-dependent methyltransferase [Candidatus Limnocylindrales bacterium]|nr:class I SAM-dependent methyltransferase [Candidatus Limnocylindrales bacterium]
MGLPETDFDRERRWWDSKAFKEETDSADEGINRALRWREIERNLEGVETILEIGGATGVFSIPLAGRGFQVTHLDLSPEMLAVARAKAQGVPGIKFVEGKASDLIQFCDRSFDLVLNMDGAISFSGTEATMAIQETCRVAQKGNPHRIASGPNDSFVGRGEPGEDRPDQLSRPGNDRSRRVASGTVSG